MDNDWQKSGRENRLMEEKNPIRQKSYDLALRITFLCRSLVVDHREYVLSKQLLRSGTSIGANVEEAQQAQSRRDFAAKCSIALKEAYESHYWMRLMRDSCYISKERAKPILENIEEIIRLLVAIVKTANSRK